MDIALSWGISAHINMLDGQATLVTKNQLSASFPFLLVMIIIAIFTEVC